MATSRDVHHQRVVLVSGMVHPTIQCCLVAAMSFPFVHFAPATPRAAHPSRNASRSHSQLFECDEYRQLTNL